jgi:hypothetical protein
MNVPHSRRGDHDMHAMYAFDGGPPLLDEQTYFNSSGLPATFSAAKPSRDAENRTDETACALEHLMIELDDDPEQCSKL